MRELFEQFDVWGAFWLTIQLSLWSALWSLLLGTALVIMRVGPIRVLNVLGAVYVNTVRNTPLTLVVLFSLTVLGTRLGIPIVDRDSPTALVDEAIRWAIFGLSVYHAAFVCEALRSGVNTVPAGQAEAARSIGLGFVQSLRHVVLPQAFRGAVAPLASTLIALIKNTTVVSIIGVAQTSYFMAEALEFRPDLTWQLFGLIAGFFLLLTLPIGIGLTALSRKVAVKR
ncbi:amino acid ABC transporter permease [Janibacter alkaliphilus]|uniref:Glutamate transport system permease protein n=1 Tax=Janibacter alkaliphilus TaxID=1069963 RepID=A0A852XC70_9MICO|nr:glutamate transport system permease protein [Janibacter alkaliphilus]